MIVTDERWRSVKPPRTNSGGAPTARRLGEGYGERRSLSPLEEGPFRVLTIAFKVQLAAPSYFKELQLRPTSRDSLLSRPTQGTSPGRPVKGGTGEVTSYVGDAAA